jgi:hypothetical protein
MMPMPSELRVLFDRFIRLGAQLPDVDDFDPSDPKAVASSKLLLDEMAKVRGEIEEYETRRHNDKPC